MSETEFLEVVNGILTTKTAPSNLDASLVDLGWDSLSNLEFVAAVDEKFGLSVDSDKLAECTSLADVFALVK